MFRKIILVPKSKDVQSSLDLGEYKDREVEKVVWTERTEFINLYNTNLFMDINSLCGCSIDDFEEAEIIGIENLESFLEIVNKFYKENPHEMCSDLISLAKSALKYKTGIYFYF